MPGLRWRRRALACALLAMAEAKPEQAQPELAQDPKQGDAAGWWPGKPNPRQLPGRIRTLDP